MIDGPMIWIHTDVCPRYSSHDNDIVLVVIFVFVHNELAAQPFVMNVRSVL